MRFSLCTGAGNSLCILFSALPSNTREGRAWCIKFTLQISNSISKHIYILQSRPPNTLELRIIPDLQQYGSEIFQMTE